MFLYRITSLYVTSADAVALTLADAFDVAARRGFSAAIYSPAGAMVATWCPLAGRRTYPEPV